MKRYILWTMMLAVATACITACSDDDGDAQPVITNVRVTEKDSTITGGEFNLTLAIQGRGLEDVQKVMFNDVEAYINPVYVTGSNIIVSIPDAPPSEVTNTITVFTKSGKSATFDFQVVLPEPILFGVLNELAPPGSQNILIGQYFYVVEKVLVNDSEVPIARVWSNAVEFTMPSEPLTDATVTLVAEGGTVTSSFKMHPTTGNMVNFDIPATGWGSDVCWGSAQRVDPADAELDVISGRYTQIKQQNLAATGWQDDWVISTCWFDFGLAPGSHETRMFNFEINIVEPWKAGFYEINITTEDGKLFQYIFKPWDTEASRASGVVTNGWRTVYIPLSLFETTAGEQIADVSKIRDFQWIFKTPDAAIDRFFVAADNFRIVNYE